MSNNISNENKGVNFIYTWRWFGPNDRITLKDIRQTGATGIVNALHQIPVGDVWSKEAILERKKIIEDAGMAWEVVESLPVSEDIKMHGGNYLEHIENYKISIRNLAECGLKTICYNFMPILDWSRTKLRINLPDGSYTSGFELVKFAAFELFILQRENAEKDYPAEVIEKAKELYKTFSETDIQDLKDTVMYGLPGSMQTYTMDEFKTLLSSYQGIDRKKLKEHMNYFLNEVIPVAEECDLRMAVHPDDPPWNLLGLPRIVSTIDDLKDVVNMIKSPSNGITFCTGSLGVGHFNKIPEIAKEMGPDIHFVHLRNVHRDTDLNFQEKLFFEGDIDMVATMKALIEEGKRRYAETGKDWIVPLRSDHGHQMFEDVGQENYPGYSLYGRMKNLAEIRGLAIGMMSVTE